MDKYSINCYLNNSMGVVIRHGVDLLGPGKTRLYLVGFYEYIRFAVYCIFYSSRVNIVEEKPGAKLLVVYGDYVVKQESTMAILTSFKNTIFEINYSELVVVNKIDVFSIPKKIYFFLKYIFKFQWEGWLTVMMALSCSRSAVDLKEVENIYEINNFAKVVTFCDAIGLENAFSAYGKSKSIITFTLQHGQYRILSSSNFSQDAEAIDNFISDFLFCWGEATVLEYLKAGYSRDKMILVGRFMDPVRQGKEPSGEFFGVALSGENSKKDNERLLMFAERLSFAIGKSYLVRYHPSNNREYYNKFTSQAVSNIEIEDYFKCCEFSIMCMTGFFLECIEVAHPFCFVDLGDLPAVFSSYSPVVSNDDDIYAVLNNINFENLKEFYNQDALQKVRVIEALCCG